MVPAGAEVVGVGDTTVIAKTTTDESGTQTTEEIPKTLLTVAVDQNEAERVIFAAWNGDLSFGLLNDKSEVKPGPGVTASKVFK